MYSEAPSERILYTPQISPSLQQESYRDYTFMDSPFVEDLTPEADCVGKLKKAFVLFNRREMVKI